MAKYAVIRLKGHQYKVEEGEDLLVDKLHEKEKPEAEVLLVKDKITKVGTPTVKGADVRLKVVDKEVKGEKLHVETFKAKSRYRRKVGFRPIYTRLKVEKISD